MRTMRTLLAAVLLSTLCASAQALTIKIATVAPEGSGWMREMRAVAEALRTHTDGRVELKFYPGGVMGNDQAVLRKIKLGQLQGGAFTGAEMSLVYRDAQIYSLPFLFRNLEEIDAVRPTVDPLLLDGFRQNGFEVVGLTGAGFAYLMSTRPIRTRDDLKASKVWVPQSDRIAQVTYEAGGVSPVALPLSDVYTALQTGLVETVGNTMSGAIAFQWHTRVKHIVDVPVTYVVGVFAVDHKTFAKLSEADQAAFREEVGKGFARLEQASREDNAKAREALVKQGISIVAPTAEELKFWEEIGETARQRMLDDGQFTPAVFQALRSALDAHRARSGGGAQ